MKYSICPILLLITPTVFLINGCSTQSSINQYGSLGKQLYTGSAVYVNTESSTAIRGVLRETGVTVLSLGVDRDSQRINQEHIVQLDSEPDTPRYGLLAGLGIGLVNALFSDAKYQPCEGNPQQQCSDYEWDTRLLIIGLLGVVGAILDAVIHEHKVADELSK